MSSAVAGPITGAFILTIAGEFLREFKTIAPVIYSVLVMLIVFFLRDGLVSLPQRIAKLWGRETSRGVAPPEATNSQSISNIKEKIWHWLKLKK